ncbi:hypothetical protein KIF59_00045 [Enterobacter cloacae subsp. cloacae]|nr:hypothetical protein [Enterobacter cloacae subsp. cloacae]
MTSPALAGLPVQPVWCKQLAHQGHCDADALHVSLNSVIDLNPSFNPGGVFSG